MARVIATIEKQSRHKYRSKAALGPNRARVGQLAAEEFRSKKSFDVLRTGTKRQVQLVATTARKLRTLNRAALWITECLERNTMASHSKPNEMLLYFISNEAPSPNKTIHELKRSKSFLVSIRPCSDQRIRVHFCPKATIEVTVYLFL